MAPADPALPVPISFIPPSTYLVFSASSATYLRRQHSIPGVLIGSLPQFPQQNVFLGLPLQLMPEEARVLVEDGVAFIVDDAEQYAGDLGKKVQEGDRQRYLKELERQGREAAMVQERKREKKRDVTLRKIAMSRGTEAQVNGKGERISDSASERTTNGDNEADSIRDDDSLFGSTQPPSSPSISSQASGPIQTLAVTPATSDLLLPPSIPGLPSQDGTSIRVPKSYPLFAHLHSKKYFISPGLRFGCQYMVYPGDPLRFHSHFLANGYDWDEEIDLMDLVGGGRLGTGVKKGFLIGGQQPTREGTDVGRTHGGVRTWCIEWAGM